MLLLWASQCHKDRFAITNLGRHFARPEAVDFDLAVKNEVLVRISPNSPQRRRRIGAANDGNVFGIKVHEQAGCQVGSGRPFQQFEPVIYLLARTQHGHTVSRENIGLRKQFPKLGGPCTSGNVIKVEGCDPMAFTLLNPPADEIMKISNADSPNRQAEDPNLGN